MTFFFTLTAQAQFGSTIDALGGAGIGAANPFESPVINPAALTQLKEYYSGFQYYRKNYLQNDNLDQYSFSATDSGPDSVFPGGFIYRHRAFDINNQRIRENLFHLAGAYAFSPKFSLGLSGYYQKTNMDTSGDYSQTNADLALFWAATKQLSFGLVQRALFGSKDDVDVTETQFKPATGFGMQYDVMGILHLRGDLTYNYEDNPNNRFIHSAGAEFLMSNDFILRMGYKADDYIGQGSYTAGLAWDGPRLKIGYAYQDEHRHNLSTSHTVDIWLNF